MKNVKVEVLFPEFANLYGDLQNNHYLERSCPSIELVETHLGDRPRFLDGEIALVTMGSTTERGLALASDALRPYLNEIKARIDAGQYMLFCGNAPDILTNQITSDEGLSITGLGLWDTEVKYRMRKRHNSFFIGSFTDGDFSTEIVGFKSLFGFTTDESTENGLCTALRGCGRTRNSKTEGWRKNNLMANSLDGPLLLLNPPFTKWLLRQIGCPDSLAFEAEAMESYRLRCEEFHTESHNPFFS